MADAPANQRMQDRRDVVDGAERIAEEPVRQIGQRATGGPARPPRTPSGGISSVVTTLLVMRNTLMISAADVSNFFVLRIRPSGFRSVSPGSPLTSGMTATPVSKPDRPRASRGKTRSATATIIMGLPYCLKSPSRQFPSTLGFARTCCRLTATTTAFNARYASDESDGDADRLLEALEKDRAQDRDQEQGDADLMSFQGGRAETDSPARARWRRRRRG